MAPITIAAEYTALLEAIQLLTTNDANGKRRDTVSVSADGMTLTYSSSRLQELRDRLKELAKQITIRNVRKRVTPDFSGGGVNRDQIR